MLEHRGALPQPLTFTAALEALHGLGLDARPAGAGWRADCPVCRERDYPLSLIDGLGGLRLSCASGCPREAIVHGLSAALRLDLEWAP
jgi:hypothetical protein